MKDLHIIKVGGSVLSNKKKIATLLDNFVALKGVKILVHGGGNVVTETALKLGYTTEMIEGRRITSDAMMEVVSMVCGGLLNKNVVGCLQARSCNAIGLCGADGKSILSKKRLSAPIDYGRVGDVIAINEDFIVNLLGKGCVPVFSPITMDGAGELLNTNADTIAAQLAIALTPYFRVYLTFCIDKSGVLSDPLDNTSVVPLLNRDTYQKMLAQKIISQGMLPKLEQSFKALERHVNQVCIGGCNGLKSPQKNTKIIL